MEADFEALVEPVMGDLYRFASRLERGDRVAAEDVLQHALLTGWRKLDQLQDPGAFKVWMCRTVYRTWLNTREKKRAIPTEDATLDLHHRPGRATPEQAVRAVSRQIGQRLSDALDRLPDDQRQAVWLVDGLGMKFGEAAGILGINAGTAASRVARGRQALRTDRQLVEVAAEQGVLR